MMQWEQRPPVNIVVYELIQFLEVFWIRTTTRPMMQWEQRHPANRVVHGLRHILSKDHIILICIALSGGKKASIDV